MKYRIETDDGDSVRVEHTDGEVLINVDCNHGPAASTWLPRGAAEALGRSILAACRAEADQ